MNDSSVNLNEIICKKPESIQDQVLKITDARFSRIYKAEFKRGMGKRKTRPKQITYSSLVTDFVCYITELSNPECTIERAEEIYSIVTTGESNHQFEQAMKEGC